MAVVWTKVKSPTSGPGQKHAATSCQWNQRSTNASSPAKLFGGEGMFEATDG